MRKAVGFLGRGDSLPEGVGYTLKRRLLGPPMVNQELDEQRLSNVAALGVLAPDGISSSAYGTEEILIELLKGGLAVTAFTLILPLTGVVLFVMALVVLSYREVVTVYTRAGGSYVVARDNFGPKVAQIAAVALLIDYVVTVAVQVAAGTAAVASAVPAIANPELITVISIAIVILMCYGNLRGIREASRAFALPTYLFSGIVILLIVTGLVREIFGDLPRYAYPRPGQYTGHHSFSGLIAFGMVFVLLRAFANGGSSLTGIEAVSNAVSAFKPPEGLNARKVLVTEGLILGTLVAGISWLAHATHSAPYTSGVPTVLAQEAHAVFGQHGVGEVLFVAVQAATALILYTGGNTSFNGFPFLANFVAEDAFLPRWLTKRGHRLVFSNGIIVLAVLSCALLAGAGANVNALVPFYAIGVFTAFTMAGFGMAKYHHTHKEPHWRRKLVINFSAGVTSLIVVAIFVLVKFTEGAWLVVILFAIGVPTLIRLNREYGMEAQVLERISDRPKPPAQPNYSRRTVFVFVDSFDLATIAALRYARSLRPTTLRAVHFVIDTAVADALREEWTRAGMDVVLDFIDCPDRRIARAAAELVSGEAAQPGVQVTVVLPRRSYSPLIGRLLHDRTADKIAAVVSRIPHAAATIVPFDVQSRLEVLHARQVAQAEQAAADKTHLPGLAEEAAKDERAAAVAAKAAPLADPAEIPGRDNAGRDPADQVTADQVTAGRDTAGRDTALGAGNGAGTGIGSGAPGADPSAGLPPVIAAPSGLRRMLRGRRRGADQPPPSVPVSEHPDYDRPAPSAGASPIGSLARPGRATVEGRVRAVEIRPVERNSVLAVDVADSTGDLTALFYGRSHIPGIDCGARVRFRGPVGLRPEGPVMINPAYELLSGSATRGTLGEDSSGGKPSGSGRRDDGQDA
jgi:amino acid transporter